MHRSLLAEYLTVSDSGAWRAEPGRASITGAAGVCSGSRDSSMESLMGSAFFPIQSVRQINPTLIVLNRETSVIRGMPGMAVLSGFVEQL